MKRMVFEITLKPAHDATGLTAYSVAQRIDVSENTIRKYVKPEKVIADTLPTVVVRLAEFYGVDWHKVVRVVEVDA